MISVKFLKEPAVEAGLKLERHRNGSNLEINVQKALVDEQERIYGVVPDEMTKKLAWLKESKDLMQLPIRPVWVDVTHKGDWLYVYINKWGSTYGSLMVWAKDNGIELVEV